MSAAWNSRAICVGCYEATESILMYYVYFLRSKETGLVKIGRTEQELHQRFNYWRARFAERFELLTAIATPDSRAENALHWYFREQRRHGEWFAITLKQIAQGLEEWAYRRRELKRSYQTWYRRDQQMKRRSRRNPEFLFPVVAR